MSAFRKEKTFIWYHKNISDTQMLIKIMYTKYFLSRALVLRSESQFRLETSPNYQKMHRFVKQFRNKFGLL